jgi:hypothetical protein
MSFERKRKTWLILGTCYLVLVCIHSLMVLWMKGPIYVADETGYLGNARFLIGKGVMPNMVGSAFYHAGYSLLISPAFWFSSDPKEIYIFVLVINGLLTSSLLLFLFYWLKKFFLIDTKYSLLASFTTCLYPAFLLNSNIAVSENALIPLWILPMIFLYLMIKHESFLWGILFGFSVSFLYTVHPRSLVLLPVSGLYLVGLTLFRILPGRITVVSFLSLLINSFVTRELNRYLQVLGWGGGGTPSRSQLLGTFLDSNGMIKIMINMVGQLWYITVSTYGLWFVGFLIIVIKIWKYRSALIKREPSSAIVHGLTFYLLSCGGILITSVLFLSRFRLSGDALIYGRYNECFIAVGVAVALGVFLENRFNEGYRKSIGPIVILILFGLSVITLGIGVKLIKDPTITGGIHWLGVFPVLGAIRFKLGFSFFTGLLGCSLYALVIILILAVAFKAKKRYGLIVLWFLFLTFTVVQYVYLLLPESKRVESLTLPKVIRAMPNVEMVSFDQAFKRPAELYRYQYFLPNTRFLFFNSSKPEFPETDLFITSRFSAVPSKIGARLVGLEKEGDLALWVKKGSDRSPHSSNLLLGDDPPKN